MKLDDAIAADAAYFARVATSRVHIIAAETRRVGIRRVVFRGISLCGQVAPIAEAPHLRREEFNADPCVTCGSVFQYWATYESTKQRRAIA